VLLNRNAIYRLEWSRRFYEFRLELIFGDNTQLPANPSIITLPFDFVSDITIKNNYEDDLPIGLPMSDTMEITINLDTIEDAETRKALLVGESTNSITINGKSFKVPNFWKLLYRQAGTSSWFCAFAGFQEKKPEKSLKIKNKNQHIEVTLNILGVHRSLLERVKPEDLKSTNITQIRLNQVEREKWRENNAMFYDYAYRKDDGSEWAYVLSAPKNNYEGLYQIVDLVPLSDILSNLKTKVDNLFYAFSRTAGNVNNFNDEFFNTPERANTILTFYFLKTNSKFQEKNSTLSASNLYVIQTIKNLDGDIIGGLLENVKDSWVLQYPTCWDLLKDWTEAWGMKCVFRYYYRYPDNVDGCHFKFKPLFSSISASRTIQNPRANISIEYGKSRITSLTFHNPAPNDLDTNKIEWIPESAIKSEKSFEIKSPLSNHSQGYGEKDAIITFGNGVIYYKPVLGLNQLWTIQSIPLADGLIVSAIVKPSDFVKYNLGDGKTIDYDYTLSSTIPLPSDYPKEMQLEVKLWEWAQNRYWFSLPMTILDGLYTYLFRFENTSIAEMELDFEDLPCGILGEMAAIDFSNFSPIDLNLSAPKDFNNLSNAIIVSIESNIKKMTSKVRFLIRGKDATS